MRTRAAKAWRALWPVVVVGGGAITCDAPSGPGRRFAQLSVVPVLSSLQLSSFAGLTIDQARLHVIRPGPPPETLKTQTFPFAAESTSIEVSLSVEVSGTEQLLVVFELLAGSQLMFTGSQTVTATAGSTTPPPTPIVPTFVGPGANVATLVMGPRDSAAVVGANVPFRADAFDAQLNAVAQYYVSWRTNATAASGHSIAGNGVFHAGNTAGQVWVYAATPTGIIDSTTITISASPPVIPTITLSLVGGGNLVGVGSSGGLIVTLSQAAPAGGVTVAVTSDSTQFLTVAGGPAVIAAGQTRDTLQLSGIAFGVASVRASATGHTSALAFFGVTPNFILLNPVNLSVAVSGTASLQVQLSTPAPTGGVAVSLMSTDVTIATVTATVNILAGQTTGNATVTGVAAGTAAILATASGYSQGGAVVTVGSGGLPTSMAKTAGDNLTAYINDTTAVRPQVRVLDGAGAPVASQTVLFTIGTGGGTIAGSTSAIGTTNASGFATPSGTWRMGAGVGANSLFASLPAFPAVTSVTFTATAQLPPPVIQLSVFGSTVVGQARTGQLNVRLLQAAPAGGVTVTLVSTRTGLLRIGTYTSENGSAVFAQGDTLKTVAVFGDSLVTGTDTVIATAPGYTPDTLAVPISLNLISLPATLNVPLSQNVSLPINLSVAAPAGGLRVALTSSDPTTVQVLTDTVTVPAGSQVASGTVRGAAIGSATVTATNPNYAPDVSTVGTTASLNITQASITPNESFGLPITIQLESGGLPVSAPPAGIAVTLTSRNPTCMTAPNTTIPAGLVSAAVLVTYGGSATTPCSFYLVASGPAGFTTDSVRVDMQPQPALFISGTYLGSGLQRNTGGSLGASNHGGTTVRVTSTNASLFLIALNDSTAGAAFQDIPVPINQSSFSFWINALEGFSNDSANFIATSTGFVPDTAKLNVYQPVFDIIFLTGSGNTRSANDPFQVRTGSPFSTTGGLSNEDPIRPGGTPMTATIINDSVPVGQLITTALSADTVTVTVAVRQARSPSTVATGGVEFDYTAAGVTNVRASAPGFRSVGAAAGQGITVSAPSLFMNPTYIGARLQRAHGGSLSAAAVAGDTVTLKVSRTGVLRISPNDSTGFADSIQVVPTGASFTFYIQGVDAVTSDSVDVFATMPSFTPDTSRFTVHGPVFDLIFLSGTGNTRSANDAFQARLGSPFTATGGISNEDVLRFGHAPLTFNIVNDSVAVGELITTALTGDSVTVQIGPRQSRSPGTVATGGVEFDYTAGGTTNVRAHATGVRSVGAALGQVVAVSAPSIFMSPTYIGARLQRAHSGSLSAAAIAGDTITLKVTRSGVLRISPNDSTGFADSIQIGIPVGQSSFTFYIQGVDNVTSDSVDVIATMPAFTPDTARYTVHQPVFDIIFLGTTANTLANSDPFQVRIGSPFSTTGGMSNEDILRFGHAPIVATLATSQATVAQLVTSSTTGSTGQVTIGPRQSRSPTTIATGGIELDYLTTGTTVVTADLPTFRVLSSDTVTVTVTAPFASLSPVTVGSGLQESASGNLSSTNHGGINIVVKSSNPAVALVSPNASTAGTDSIIIAMPPNNSFISYYVQGVEGVTGAPQQVQFRVTAPGFTDGIATMTVVQPGLDIIFLATSGSAASSLDDEFVVRIGVPNSPTNSGITNEQVVRAGGTALTATVTSSNTSAGRLVTTAVPGGGSPVTVQIVPGQARSPATVALGGVAFDFVAAGQATVAAVIANFIATTAASRLVNVTP